MMTAANGLPTRKEQRAELRRMTRKQLLSEISSLYAAMELCQDQAVKALEQERAARKDSDEQRRGAIAHATQLRTDLDDVKERLAIAGAEVQRMAGYISRVQEDDVVREPLVQVGDTDGEQQLVPKRKPTHFVDLKQAHHQTAPAGMADYGGCASSGRDRKPPRHWVRY